VKTHQYLPAVCTLLFTPDRPGYFAHIMTTLASQLRLAHHQPHNHAEETMDSCANHSADKPPCANSRKQCCAVRAGRVKDFPINLPGER
jgi:trans-aconitate methyltransferase